MPTNLSGFLREYRDLLAQGEKVHFQRMILLVELKPLSVVWQTSAHPSWNGFLSREQLCPPATFGWFEKALTFLKRDTIKHIGVDAAIVLAKIEEHLREPTLTKVEAYIAHYSRRPGNRIVWTFVRALRLLPLNVKPVGKGKRATIQ